MAIFALNKGGTITAGGTAQVAMAANSSRAGMVLENPDSATEKLFYSFAGTATTSSPSLKIGQAIALDARTCPGSALSVLGATTAHPFVCEEFVS